MLPVIAAQPPPELCIMAADTARVKHPAGFAVVQSPFAAGGAYLSDVSRSGARPGSLRVAAPAGSYYVYVAWMRHPKGAKSVVIRCAGHVIRVDMSRLANGASPESYPHDDMAGFDGVCSSGMFRLNDRPWALGKGETVEIVRSDDEPDAMTTLNYVVFSPVLYLDDLGNDAALKGRPTINLRNYGTDLSGPPGAGIAFVPAGHSADAIEFNVPADGAFLLSANPNYGPTRSNAIPLTFRFADGRTHAAALSGAAPAFGRGPWVDMGVLRAAKGARIVIGSASEGWACMDMLRLTPVSEDDLAPSGQTRFDTYVIQWEEPSAGKPWLRSVKVVPADEDGAVVEPLPSGRGMAHGVHVRIPRRRIPILGEDGTGGFLVPGDGSMRVELADDYGFTLTCDLLQTRPFVWLKDPGIFACAGSDFAAGSAGVRAMEARARRARTQPFLSTSERYYRYTGHHETDGGMDDRSREFAYHAPRSERPRTVEAIAAMPEVGYRYFERRVEDPRHRRMFLGWPNVCQEFYLLSNGCIGVSSGSGVGTGHPPAQHFTVQVGVGERAVWKEHGDPSVTQRLEDGYHIVCETRWKAAGADVRETALAYPLAGEEVRTGNEPLAAFVRLVSSARTPLWLRIRPDQWGGEPNPLRDLAAARVEGRRIMAGRRVVLAFDHASAAITAASDREVLVRLAPDGGRADLVIPYISVSAALVEEGLKLGFDGAHERMKRFWDVCLTRGARIETPDDVVNNEYKTLYARTMVTGDLDAQGEYVLKTSPINYDLVWLHATAYGIEGLARRGHFEEARRYLEAVFHWQGAQGAQDAPGYTTWKGFFNAPPRYTPLLWINFHGWSQWAAARYFLFSDDRAWLAEKLPALVKSLEWTASQRRLTMKDNPDGSRPANWGWLPPARVTDGSTGTSAFGDCVNWLGFDEVTRLLERIGHPRAAEFRAIADDYRCCIVRGLRLAARDRLPVRLNDGTWVPYVPGYLESRGHEEDMWYAAVVDGALEGVLDSGILEQDDPLRGWVQRNLEDNLFVMAPNLADEAYFLGHGINYVRHDEPAMAVYTFYSVLASHMSRRTLTTFEHRSWGAGRVWDLAPWPMGYYTRLLSNMLCDDENGGLFYGKATPRAWLDPGKGIRVERLQTRFGPTTLALRSERETVRGHIELPARYTPAFARLRLRVNGRVLSVRLNGRETPVDPATGAVELPIGETRVRVEAAVARE